MKRDTYILKAVHCSELLPAGPGVYRVIEFHSDDGQTFFMVVSPKARWTWDGAVDSFAEMWKIVGRKFLVVLTVPVVELSPISVREILAEVLP